MLKTLSIVAISALAAAAAFSAPSGEARAQVMVTPPGCQWLDGATRGEQELFCRDEDGRAYRTETRRRDMGGNMDVCPVGQMDDGLGCVGLAAAQRSAMFGLQYDPMAGAPPPFDWKAAKTSDGKWRDPNKPDVIIMDRGYRGHRGYRSGYGDSGYRGYNTGYIVRIPD